MGFNDTFVTPPNIISPMGGGGSGGGPGTPGEDGEDGKTWLSGAGAPDPGLGVDGDFYLDLTADAYYGPKTAGAWGSATSLIGPQGPAGATGATGPAGPAPSGGSDGQFVKRVAGDPVWASIAGGDIASGTVAPERLGSGTPSSSNFLRGDGSWQTVSGGGSGYEIGTALPNAASPGGSTRSIHTEGATSNLAINVATGGVIKTGVNGATTMQQSNNAVTLSAGVALAMSSAAFTMGGGNITGIGNLGGNGSMVVFSTGLGSSIALLVGSILGFGGGVVGYGTSHAQAGQLHCWAVAVSLANGATRTVLTSGASRTGGMRVIDAINGRQAVYDLDGGTVSKVRGHSQFVAGAPGSGEVGLENSSGTIRINNNSGGILDLTAIWNGV